jgi:competence protein ComEC
MKRPLGIVALLYGCGVMLGEVLQPPLAVLLSLSAALTAGALLVPRGRAALLPPLILFTGLTGFVWHTAVISPHDLRGIAGAAPELVAVRGRLTETPGLRLLTRHERASLPEGHTLAQVRVNSLRQGATWQPAAGRIMVSTAGVLGPEFHAGQAVEITGVLNLPPLPVAEGLFDYRGYLRRQGIHYHLKAQTSNDWRLFSAGANALPLKDRFLAWAKASLARGLPQQDESLRLEWALSLGDKTVLTDDVAEPFVRAATFHIFAVDGLRMAIIFGILFALSRALRLPRSVCGMLLVPLIWLYTGLTGWPASAIRASVMLTIVIVGWALKRPPELINSLFAAALILLVWDPQQLFQAGFQLSFLVVLCIILVLPPLRRFGEHLLRPDPLLPQELRPHWQRIVLPPLRRVLDLLLTSVAAWLGSIPLVAYYFHILTPVSGPANLVAVPLCALVLVSDFVSLLLAGWFPQGAELFNHAGWFLMECIRVTSRWFAGWPGAYYYVTAPSLFTVGLYYLVLLTAFTGWLFKPPRRRAKLVCLALLALIWCWQWQREWSATRLTVLPLNGGSAVYFDAPGARNDLLVDCGSTTAVERVLKPFLRAQGVNRLPYLILTHGDLRQMGGAQRLLELVPIKQTATSSARFRSPAYRQMLARLENTPERWRVLDCGCRLDGWRVLHPDRGDHFAQADDSALVLLGNIRGVRILLLSDLGKSGQNALLERGADVRADIVVAGLPQNSEPLGDALLDAIRPRVVIITDSEFPATRRAGAPLRRRLERRGIPVLYTANTGAIKITLRPRQWEAGAMNGLRFSGPLPAGLAPSRGAS